MKKPVVAVGQSGGPTAAINASLAGVIEGARSLGGRTIGMRYGIEGALSGNFVDLDLALPTARDLEALAHTPSSFLGSCRYKLPDPGEHPEVFAELLAKFEALEADAVLYIGGNDSMDTIAKLATYGRKVGSSIRFVGIPKTIDNDLVGIDHTPGYGSAAKFVATCIQELALDSRAYDLRSVLIVEIMGRDAGWLAASAALAPGAADAILLPETHLETDALISHLDDLVRQKTCVVLATSESITDPSGKPLYQGDSITDAFGHARQRNGMSRYLQNLVRTRLNCKARAIELSTTQRSAAHLASATDLAEARALGCFGAREALIGSEEAFGAMASLVRVSDVPYATELCLADVAEVANKVKNMPASMITADGFGVTGEFLAYARPLIRGEAYPAYVEGVPETVHL
jgi:6-phosphofructokinase 1